MSFDHVAQARKRILWQYRDGPKYRAWIETLPTIAQGNIEDVSLQLRDVLDLDNANSWQLDIIGLIVGQPRNLSILDDDATYKQVIRSKIARNNSFATIDGIKEAVEFVTGEDVFELSDGFDMSFSITFNDPIDPVTKELLLTVELVPRPQGVRFVGFVEPQSLPKFGVDGLGTEEPAENVEGFGELGLYALEVEPGVVLAFGDGTIMGMNDSEDYFVIGGGHLAELYEV